MRDVIVKGIPEAITDAQVLEWCSVLVERFEKAKVNEIPEIKTATETANISIDAYREANLLKPKFKVVEAVEG